MGKVGLDDILRQLVLLSNKELGEVKEVIMYHLHLQVDNDKITKVLDREISNAIQGVQQLRNGILFGQIFSVMGFPTDEKRFADRFMISFCSMKFLTPKVLEEYGTVFRTFSFKGKLGNSSKLSFMDKFEIIRREKEIRDLPFIDFFVKAHGFMRILDFLYSVQKGKPSSIPSTPPIESLFDSKTYRIIHEQFETMGSGNKSKGWKYAFNSEDDYDEFCGLLTSFFEHGKYELPSSKIRLKAKTRTEVAKNLRTIYRKLGETMAGDTAFFDIVRVLNHFEELSDEKIYRDLTR